MNEWIIVGAIALLVLLFGAKKLPELARGVGRTKTEYKRGLNEDLANTEAQRQAWADEAMNSRAKLAEHGLEDEE